MTSSRRSFLRAILAAATFTVVWLIVTPASATMTPSRAAPVCDPRGAITFAPPPQIQDTETSLDIPPDCFDINPLETRNFVPGRGNAQLDLSSSQEPTAPPALAVLAYEFVERLPVADIVLARPPPGVRSSLDRPPRI